MKNYVYISLLLVLTSCATWRKSLVDTPGIEGCIHNTIVDFLHTSKLCKTDSVFSIAKTEGSLKVVGDLLVLCICEWDDPFYMHPHEVAGTKPTHTLLHGYIDTGDILFLLPEMSKDTILTHDYLNILKKYNRIDYSWIDESVLPPYSTNDGAKYMYYIFCPNNPKKYKKTKTTEHFDKKRKYIEKKIYDIKCY